MRARPIVAIDGPSGSGKSTVGKRLARALGFRYVDTGAMYRAIALSVLEDSEPEQALSRAGALARRARIETRWDPDTLSFSIALDGRDVSVAVRGAAAASWASRVARDPAVRAVLLEMQRDLGREGGVVMEGRDIGTVVFPDAEVKIFLEAPLAVRGLPTTGRGGTRRAERRAGDADPRRPRFDARGSTAPPGAGCGGHRHLDARCRRGGGRRAQGPCGALPAGPGTAVLRYPLRKSMGPLGCRGPCVKLFLEEVIARP